MSTPIKLKTIFGPKEDFNVPVIVKNLHGQDVQIDFACKARTKTEWAPVKKEIVATRIAKIKEQAEAALKEEKKAKDDDTAQTWKDTLKRVKEFEESDAIALAGAPNAEQAAIALKIANGWSLDIPMNAENLAAMEDAYPGSIEALVGGYDSAVFGAREKN